jgi:hypothetical protein
VTPSTVQSFRIERFPFSLIVCRLHRFLRFLCHCLPVKFGDTVVAGALTQSKNSVVLNL